MEKPGKRAITTSRSKSGNRLLTTVTIYFHPPKSSEVAVKVIDKAGMETMWARSYSAARTPTPGNR